MNHKVRLVRGHKVCQIFDISKATLWRWSQSLDNFPKPIKIGGRAVAYDMAEIEAFIEGRKAKRNANS